jgi:acyl phosphate:glycerol-3-phosphate acyltransferase
MVVLFVVFFAAAYILGSINFSIILFNISGKGDPRSKFSGNAGATNVYRQAGMLWALAILILDMGRAMLIAYASFHLLDTAYITWTGLALILGNRYPCFHSFKGGKGVANYLGFTLVLAPLATMAASLFWAVAYLFFRTPFISSFVMTVILATGTMNVLLHSFSSVMGTLTTALFIFYSHKDNVIEKVKNMP